MDSSGTRFWDERRGAIFTDRGVARLAEGVIRTRDVDHWTELCPDRSYMQVFTYAVTGRLDHHVVMLLEYAFMGTSYCDHRIWCNQVGSLAGSAGVTPGGALAAGLLASDSILYGGRLMARSAEVLLDIEARVDAGGTLEAVVEELSRQRGIPGFLRPINPAGDERVVALEEILYRKHSFPVGRYRRRAVEVDECLRRTGRGRMNHAGFLAAGALDVGLTVREQRELGAACTMAGILSCYGETRAQPQGAFLPLRCDDVKYDGPNRRPVPRRPEGSTRC